MKIKICVICGTRPEIIKMSPVVRECQRLGLDYFILHTGQHYSYNMDGVFFEQLELPKPKYNLSVGSGTHAEEIAKMLVGIEKALCSEKPDVALVLGDSNTVISGALVASRLNIKVGHIEAGLRSYDRSMPEEINRILTDHCSDYWFAPTERARANLEKEGISNDRVFVTGNTIVDAVYQNIKLAKIAEKGDYILATIHRQENVDNVDRFRSILEGLEMVARECRVIYPIHPRSRKMLGKFGLDIKDIELIEPVDYLTFLGLEKNAKLIMTDSGGVQEEACILGVPCVTLRDNTERPETVEVGANILAGASPWKIANYAKIMMSRRNSWANPFGDGKAGQRIVEIIRRDNGCC